MWEKIKKKFREFVKSELDKEIEKLEIRISEIIEAKFAEMISTEEKVLEETRKKLDELTKP